MSTTRHKHVLEPEPLAEVLRMTGERKKSPAVAKALAEYVRRRKAEEFGRLLRESAFDYPPPGAMSSSPPWR